MEAGDTPAGEYWYHERLYGALITVVMELGKAHPGGLDRLQPRR
ncbi:hypothetical protein ACFQYP_65625 [Nonomuraea antimicrobica]